MVACQLIFSQLNETELIEGMTFGSSTQCHQTFQIEETGALHNATLFWRSKNSGIHSDYIILWPTLGGSHGQVLVVLCVGFVGVTGRSRECQLSDFARRKGETASVIYNKTRQYDQSAPNQTARSHQFVAIINIRG